MPPTPGPYVPTSSRTRHQQVRGYGCHGRCRHDRWPLPRTASHNFPGGVVMRARRSLVPVVICAILWIVGSAAGAPPPLAPVELPVPTFPTHPTPPPDFATPAGGRKLVERMPSTRIRTTIYRADGTRLAEARGPERGQYDEITYYNESDVPYRMISGYSGSKSSSHSARRPSATNLGRPSRSTNQLQSLASCGGNASSTTALRIPGTLNWYWVSTSTPGNLSQSATLIALRNAGIAWVINDNWCGIGDSHAANSFNYVGTTSVSWGQNGVSTIGWGTLGGSGPCAATNAGCADEYTAGGFSFDIVEADIRLNAAFPWVNGSSGGWDVQGVTTHERGHNLAFEHVGDNTNVMWAPFPVGTSFSNRRLGRGDANVNNSKY